MTNDYQKALDQLLAKYAPSYTKKSTTNITNVKSWDRFMAKMQPIPMFKDDKEMKKYESDLYTAARADEDSLIEAYKAKKLKSKRLIKEAHTLVKKRKAEAAKANKAKSGDKPVDSTQAIA